MKSRIQKIGFILLFVIMQTNLSWSQKTKNDTIVITERKVVFYTIAQAEYDTLVQKKDSEINEILSDFDYYRKPQILEKFVPDTFLNASGVLIVCLAILIALITLFRKERSFPTKVFAIFFIIGLCFLSNHVATYFAAIFIIATTVTKLDFLQNLAAIIRGDKHYFEYLKAKQGFISPQEVSQEKESKRNPMQHKILNTLWTKQVNHHPMFDRLWTFRLNIAASEYLSFRENINRLIGEGLVSETEGGQYFLTPDGWEYCKQNHKEFPPEQWWPEEKMNKENLNLVLPEDT